MTNIIYPLKHFIIDVYWTNQHDLYVYAEYVSPMSYRVYVRRLDTYSNEGWDYDLRLLLYSPIHGISEQISFGSSETAEKIQLLDNPFENILFEPADDAAAADCVLPPPSKYRQYVARMSEPNYCQIGYETFNQLFDAEMPLLPSSLYAVGIRDGTTYIYNEKYSHYYEIAPTVNFLVNILYDRQDTRPTQYFVISACDGFPSGTACCERTVPVKIADVKKYENIFTPTLLDISENAYEIYHKNRWILTQNNHIGGSYRDSIPMPDHHYFVMNQYREFRWLHEGRPWDGKIAKIVFAGSIERSSKYNFRTHPIPDEPELTQRQYFYRLFTGHSNVVAIQSGWNRSNFLSRDEQIQYKYILDMDGEASTWDSLAWKLRSGSVLFRVAGIWNQWFFDKLIPGKHYVPIKEDFSDLIEKYEWCEDHPDECKQMILDACRVFEVYRLQNAHDYVVDSVLDKII